MLLYRGLSEGAYRQLINDSYMRPKRFNPSQPPRVDFTTSRQQALRYGDYALATANSKTIKAKKNTGVKNRWSVFGKVPLRSLKKLQIL